VVVTQLTDAEGDPQAPSSHGVTCHFPRMGLTLLLQTQAACGAFAWKFSEVYLLS